MVDPGRFHGFNEDFTTFWTQAAQQGFHPKVVTVGKALEFPGPA